MYLNNRNIIALAIVLSSVSFCQEINRLQLIAKFEMNFNWLDPWADDSSFFDYDSFTYAGFSPS